MCGGGGGGQGDGSPGEKRAGGVREAGEERAGSGSSKRAGSGRKIAKSSFFKFNNALEYFQKQEPKSYLTCI